MAVAIKRPHLRNKSLNRSLAGAGGILLLSAILFGLAQRGWWFPAALMVASVEWAGLLSGRTSGKAQAREAVNRVLPIVMGISAAIIISLMPRLGTQVVVAIGFAAWRAWWAVGGEKRTEHMLAHVFVVQAALFEALFLVAARWRGEAWHEWTVLLAVWGLSYAVVYSGLSAKGERAAGLMAAAWALAVAQVSWVLLTWLFTYATVGGYVLVPQPALILVAMSYCFGSIYASARKGKLSRSRLAEYLLIGLVVMGMVITGTTWQGTI